MKYCPYCKQWNIGQPTYCRRCARTWGSKKCRSGHDNPEGSLVCGICGSPEMSESSGRMPLLIRLVGFIKPAGIVLLVLLGVSMIADLIRSGVGDTGGAMIVGIVFMVGALYGCFKIIGPSLGSSVSRLFKGLFDPWL